MLNWKVTVKQDVNNHYCDKVLLIFICIDTLTAKGIHTVKQCSNTVKSIEHRLFN